MIAADILWRQTQQVYEGKTFDWGDANKHPSTFCMLELKHAEEGCVLLHLTGTFF